MSATRGIGRTASPGAILAVISFGVFVAADDLTVVSTMLRQIIFDLEIPMPDGLDDAAWIVNAYLIAYVVVMPFVGRLSDIVGRRPVYIGALVLFLAGSVWVPLANTLPSFIFGRVLTALGGGAMVPVGMAIIGDVYRPARRPSALGTLAAIDTAGWVWGPLYGALLIRFLDWRWQFYINIPLSLIGIALAWWALARLPKPKKVARIDWLGTALLSAGLLSLSVALLNSSEIQSAGSLNALSGQEEPSMLPLYLVAVAAFALFALVERRLARVTRDQGAPLVPSRVEPLLDPALFRRPNFSQASIINFLVGAVLIIAMVNVPLLINVLEVDPQQAALRSGLILSAMTASMAIMAYVGGRLTERWSYRPVALAGLTLVAIALALMGWTWSPDSEYAQMALQLAVLGAGFGLITAPIGAAVINAAPDDQLGIASSLVIVLRLIGMSVGLSSLTAWGLYRFDILRAQVDLPPIDDPGFPSALADGLTSTTVAVLAETFLISSLIALAAWLVALALRPEARLTDASD
ncbi:MAG: MFS transporter [Chloroflexota bacterium]|nr:MAG: MFS transporter [Chloroflexota bacterium]